MGTRDREEDRRADRQYIPDVENTLPQKNLTTSHEEKVEEGWEAVFGIYNYNI